MKWKLGIFLALTIGMYAGQAQTVAPPPAEAPKAAFTEAPKVAAPEAPGTDAAPKTPAVKRYVVGLLDVLDIRVWNDPKMSGIFNVGPDGIFSMPLIGEIKADGLTVVELTKLIRDRISATVTNEPPDVNIQVLRTNSQKIYILGAVYRQGEMPLSGEMRILDAISNCGGFKDFAKATKIYVLRGDKRFYFNYKEVLKGKKLEQNILLENGDHIVVPGD